MAEAVLALGNELKSDDRAGKYIIENLKGKSNKILIYGGLAPENYLFQLKDKGISRLYIIDAAELNLKSGDIKIFKKIDTLPSISTHSTDMSSLISYIKKITGIQDIFVILIQTKSLELGGKMSKEVKKSANKIVKFLS